MNADEAIRKRGAMHAAVGDISELHAAVSERVAVRGPPGDWTVMRCASAVRLFLKAADGYVSRYVWQWQETDPTVDLLLAAAKRKQGLTTHQQRATERADDNDD